jgi:hypothetical protein
MPPNPSRRYPRWGSEKASRERSLKNRPEASRSSRSRPSRSPARRTVPSGRSAVGPADGYPARPAHSAARSIGRKPDRRMADSPESARERVLLDTGGSQRAVRLRGAHGHRELALLQPRRRPRVESRRRTRQTPPVSDRSSSVPFLTQDAGQRGTCRSQSAPDGAERDLQHVRGLGEGQPGAEYGSAADAGSVTARVRRPAGEEVRAASACRGRGPLPARPGRHPP